MPKPSVTPLELTSCQSEATASVPSATRRHQTAPMMPPIRACEELDGMPKYQVNRFQRLAPSKAATTTVCVTAAGSTMPSAIILATPTPVKPRRC